MSKGSILSGMRPTGMIHLGNYFGALDNWIDLQNEYDCHFFVADWHALTTGYEDVSMLKQYTYGMVADWIASGLDPEKCVIFLQSKVKEHTELFTIFSMITPLSWLERCPTYKAQLEQLSEKNIMTYGFLGYPCLQAADILLYKAAFVPVGEDQLPHIELTREIGRRFNYLYKEIFPEPQPLMTKTKNLVGLDGRKMSKSYDNTIALSDSPETVNKKVMQMTTDPARIRKDDPGHPDVCAVYAMHKIFNADEVGEVEASCKKGTIGCVGCKKNLAAKMAKMLTPVYEKRTSLMEKPAYIAEIIDSGSKKASHIAAETMAEVKDALGMQ